MTVLIFEKNLMWSARIAKSARALGHEPHVLQSIPEPMMPAEFAIINLGEPIGELSELVTKLHAQGTKTIGHAGHKERELMVLGNDAGCGQVVSNSTLTFKLGDLLSP